MAAIPGYTGSSRVSAIGGMGINGKPHGCVGRLYGKNGIKTVKYGGLYMGSKKNWAAVAHRKPAQHRRVKTVFLHQYPI